MGQRLVDEFLSGMQNLFQTRQQAHESESNSEEYMQRLMQNELTLKQLAFLLYDLGFTEFAPDAGGSLHNQTDILAVYKLLTTYAHVDEDEKFLQTIPATSLFYFLCYLMRLEKLIPKEVAASELSSGYSKDYTSQTSEDPPPFLFVNRIFTMNKHEFKKNQAVLIDQFFGLLACRSKVERDARNLEKKAQIVGDHSKEETFAPKINKSSRYATSLDGSLSQRDYGELLSKRSDTKQLKIQILKAEKREQEIAECSFVPYMVSR